MTDHEANLVMEALDKVCLYLTPTQERALFNHLYYAHKIRDEAIYLDLADKVYGDYYDAQHTLDLWRDIDHA